MQRDGTPGFVAAGKSGAPDRTPKDRVDVCVIGAGPAGALVADRLAGAGHDIVVLEAGPRFDPDERTARQERALRSTHGPHSVWEMGGPRDAFASSGERFYPLNAARVKGVGGTTLHWEGMVMRLHETDFDGTHGRPWPIDYADLQSSYAAAERAFGVAGADDNPFAPPRDEPFPMAAFPPSHSDTILAEACESLGITTHSVPNARNSEAYDGRSACVGYGTCRPVCPSGAKYDATVHVGRAKREGARVIDRAPVQHLETGEGGDRIEAAVYATPDRTTHRQRAHQFVLAAGGVEIPRLLLLSRSDSHPDGLANSSGLVGRYFTEHLFAGAGGILDRPTRQHHVTFQTTESHQFYDRGGERSEPSDRASGEERPSSRYRRSVLAPIKLELRNEAGPTPAGIALDAETFGDDLLESIRESYGSHVAVGGLVGQEPNPGNRITLDTSRTDDHGIPVPDVQWSLSERDRRTIERANEHQHAILEAAGAEIEWTVGPDDAGPAYHHMGTTRMGTDPDESVVDPHCRTHDLDNCWIASSSVFVTPGAMNPTLTIAALALRIADDLKETLEHGSLRSSG